MTHEYSERFLNAFSKIENSLRSIIGAHRHEPFYWMVEKASKKSKAVRAFATELKEFADLRNAIVHERIDGRPIAEPHPETVQELEEISVILDEPPKIRSGFVRDVVTCSPSDSIGQATRFIIENSFSQIPVYDDYKFIGLLTTETVALWLADRLKLGTGLVKEENVNIVLKYARDRENYAFLDPDSSLFDVIYLFEDFNQKGKALNAILVTDSGSQNKKPIGILTIFDLPRVYEAIGVKVSN